MPESRLEILHRLVEQNPEDSRTRYMLAMELAGAGDLEGALREYEALLARDPAYCYAYFHAGRTLERLGRTEEARQMYRRGIEAAERAGDAHAREELRGALEALG
ncbi:MAG: tetratricopeptide repeat protein [Bryobacterales bacterium]|nr:tetratricopeptide repeat protein [Bryobacteraceae bacterium]MDW8353213.1 tetratricopeptide repeat protein [Bryobacterales bacterium]